jgi:prepilin-type N-terminal cleavage/methylation domain-containing protein
MRRPHATRRDPSTPLGMTHGFTLVEIVIAVFIMLLLLGLAMPSVNGVMADKRLHRSLDAFNDLVRQGHERSLAEHRAYLIVVGGQAVALQPASFFKGEAQQPVASIPIVRNEKWRVEFPAALSKKAAPEWIFWESGVCEPARISFASSDGKWTAEYSALSGLPEIVSYGAR